MKISKEMMKSWAETYDDANTKYYWLSDIITLKSSDNLHCEYCGEHDPEYEDGKKTFIVCQIRPYDIFCSYGCINNHIDEIECGVWTDYDGHNKGLEIYYKDEIKNNWKDFDFDIWEFPYNSFSLTMMKLKLIGKIFIYKSWKYLMSKTVKEM